MERNIGNTLFQTVCSEYYKHLNFLIFDKYTYFNKMKNTQVL